MKSFKQEKRYYSIREVAKMFNVNTSLLRYWETEFDFIQPEKTDKGIRQYQKKNIEAIRLVYNLVKERGLTLAGAKQRLKNDKEGVIHNEEIIHRLKSVRTDLEALKEEIEAMEKYLINNDA